MASVNLSPPPEKSAARFDSYMYQLVEQLSYILTNLDTENMRNSKQAADITNAATSVSFNIDMVYPVGSIYMSVNNTDPGTLFGGTWARWGQGRVPVGLNENDPIFSVAEVQGGSQLVTLTTSQMPAHGNHLYADSEYSSLTGLGTAGGLYLGKANMTEYYTSPRGWSYFEGNEVYPSGKSIGGGMAHNNLQPYITCYMWKRTA